MRGLEKPSMLLLTLVTLALLVLIAAVPSGCGSKKIDAPADAPTDGADTENNESASGGTSAEGSAASSGEGSAGSDTAGDDSSTTEGQNGDSDTPPQGEISDLQRDLLGHWTNGISDLYISETRIVFAMVNEDNPSFETDYYVAEVLEDENILVIDEEGTTEYVKFKDDRRSFNIYPDYDSAVRDLSDMSFTYIDDRTSLTGE